jgi:hypothetical protein
MIIHQRPLDIGLGEAQNLCLDDSMICPCHAGRLRGHVNSLP